MTGAGMVPELRSVLAGGSAGRQTTERTAVAEVVEDIQKILYSTAEDVVVEAT